MREKSKHPGDMFTYVLRDPRDGSIRYVGSTNEPKRRLWQHQMYGTKTAKWDWIKGLQAENIVPVMEIVETVPITLWVESEKRWIALMRAVGEPILNVSEGGHGPRGMKKTPEQCRAMSEARKGVPSTFTLEQREAARQRMIGNTWGRMNKGMPMPEDKKELRRQIFKGRILTPEHLENLRASAKKPEVRAKISAARKGWNPSAETRARMSASARKKKLTPEHRAKIVAANLRRWETRVDKDAFVARMRSGITAESRARMSQSVRERQSTSEGRAKASERFRKAWTDPAYRERVLATRRVTIEARKKCERPFTLPQWHPFLEHG